MVVVFCTMNMSPTNDKSISSDVFDGVLVWASLGLDFSGMIFAK